MKNIFSSIIFRLIVLSLLFSLFPIVIISVFGTKEIETATTNFVLKHTGKNIAPIAKALSIIEENNITYAINDLFKGQDGFFFSITDKGNIYILSSNKGKLPPYIDTYIKTIKKGISSGKYGNTLDYKNSILISVKPYGKNKYLVRLLHFTFAREMANGVVDKILQFMLLSILLTTVLLGIMIYYNIGVPIKVLTEAAQHISSKEFDLDIDKRLMAGEFKTLSEAFIFASEEIERGISALNKSLITEKKKNREIASLNRKLLSSSKQYREIFNASFVAIFIHDSKGNLIDVNDTMIKMYGLHSKKEALSYTIRDYSSSDTDPEDIELIMKRAESGSIETFEWKARRPLDDSTFSAQVSLREVSFDNKTSYILANVIDISEKKETEEKLIRAQKLETVGILVGGIAHDFNNVLAGIMGPLSILEYKLHKDNTIEQELLAKYLKSMDDSTKRASRIVQQLLSLSRKQIPKLSLMDLNKAIRSIEEIAHNSFDKSITLHVQYYPHPALIQGDSSQIEQILLNIAVNAAHAMTIMKGRVDEWGGKLTITVDKTYLDNHFCESHATLQEGYHYIVSITDTGVGMDSSTRKHIFTPFFTTKESGTGTGLGLAMVYNLLTLHQGTIDVYSEKGKGTRFTLYIPEAQKEEQEHIRQKKQGSTIKTSEGTILVIDDEKIIRETVKDMLKTAGYTVLLASNGREGIEIFRKYYRTIDLVLLDMAMPEMSGSAVYPELIRIDKNIKVILSSGFREDSRVQTIMKLGVNSFVQKPYTLHTLLAAVGHLMEKRTEEHKSS